MTDKLDARPYWEKCRDRPDLYDVKVEGGFVSVLLKRVIPLDALKRAIADAQK